MYERKILELDLNDILPNRFQPRIKFDETSIMDLAESIKEHGVIQPIVVRRLGDRYEIIAGERRYKASVIAGKTTIPAIIAEVNDKDSAEIALIENVQRQDLTPIEEAISYKKILDMGYLTQEDLAEKLGKTQSTIANKIRLLNLDEEVQSALLEAKISERHARSLLKLSDKKKQCEMLERIIKERLTVRKTDEEIAKMMNDDNNVEILDFNEPAPVPTPTYNMPETPIIEDVIEPRQENVINPGFMDVEKIEKEATDITSEIRPIANMDDLLKNPMEQEIPVVPTVEPNVEESEESLLKPGKFFNILEESEKQENNVQPSFPTMDSFSFDSTPSQPETTTPDFFNEPAIEKPTPIIPVQPEPLVQYPENPTIENKFSMDTAPTMTLEESPEQFSNQNQQLGATMNPAPTNTTQPKNIKEAIDVIQKCANELKNLGFTLDLEEYDFEDMYQVIVKVNKN